MTPPMDEPQRGPLGLTLEPGVGGASAQRFPVIARFDNQSSRDLRLLDLFHPLPVFFTTRLVSGAGAEIDVVGAGKLEPVEGRLRYVELSRGATHEVELDLAPWIRAELPGGAYSLAMSYHNAYGDGCFRGVVDSTPIMVNVGEN